MASLALVVSLISIGQLDSFLRYTTRLEAEEK